MGSIHPLHPIHGPKSHTMGSMPSPNIPSHVTHTTPILIVGAGPVGLVTAYYLAHLGQPCMLIEQSTTTTQWPKMELTQARSMELFRKMGLVEELRKQGIPGTFELNEVITTGYGEGGDRITLWKRGSPDTLRKKWAESNDGSHPLEPYMRQSQIIFEAWMKPLCQKHPLIESHWGYSFQHLVETEDAVYSTFADSEGNEMVVKSKYVVGCDGAGSRVRQSAGLESKRKTLPMHMMLVHFKSRDLVRLQSQGLFWHAMFLNGAACVSQDEVETWTIHQLAPPDTDPDKIDALDFISSNLGGLVGPYPVKVDEVLVKSIWRSDLAVADSFRSAKGKVFLAGDSAHQLTPAGGHGFNSGVADAFDVGWKLTAVLKGYGGEHLLQSYDHERRSVAKNNIKVVEIATMEILLPIMSIALKLDKDTITAQDEKGKKLRAELKGWIDRGWWVHNQNGTDMGYRFNGSPAVLPDPTSSEPPQSIQEYIPSTWPGSRAPHVFLSDGITSIFDLYGPGFTIVDFSSQGKTSKLFSSAAKELAIPLKEVHIPDEKHVREIWERDIVLLRPEGHVAWRAPREGLSGLDEASIKDILLVAVGKELSPGYVPFEEVTREVGADVSNPGELILSSA